MALPVFEVGFGQLLRTDDQEVLRVLFLGGLCEVERAGDDDRPVDEDDLVVGNGVLFVDVGRDAGIRQKGRSGRNPFSERGGDGNSSVTIASGTLLVPAFLLGKCR